MTLLLDNHTLLWFLTNDSNLSARARGAIEDSMLLRLLPKSKPLGPSALRQALPHWVPIAASVGEKHPLGLNG